MTGHLRTIDGQEHPVGDGLPPIECFRCGVCCIRYQPPLMPGEVSAIAAGLGMSAAAFLAEYGQLTYVGYLLRRSGDRCVFLGDDAGGRAGCRIHPFRPVACRDWVASLSCPECRDGLGRLKAGGKIMLASELYPPPEAAGGLSPDLPKA